eukprot:scaffold210619_cov28-Tisochrysis_lutea.AAC.1
MHRAPELGARGRASQQVQSSLNQASIDKHSLRSLPVHGLLARGPPPPSTLLPPPIHFRQ